MRTVERRGGPRPNAGRPKGEPSRVIRLPRHIAEVAQRLAKRGLRPGDVAGFYEVAVQSDVLVPLYLSRAACGFPSPADDYLDRPIDLNELLMRNPPATFMIEVAGESMTGAGIYPGDHCLVDRSIDAYTGCIVLACLDNEFTIKRYVVRAGTVTLKAENPAFSDVEITEHHDFRVFGVIRNSIRHHG